MLYDVKTSIYAGLSQFLTSTNEEITLEEFENEKVYQIQDQEQALELLLQMGVPADHPSLPKIAMALLHLIDVKQREASMTELAKIKSENTQRALKIVETSQEGEDETMKLLKRAQKESKDVRGIFERLVNGEVSPPRLYRDTRRAGSAFSWIVRRTAHAPSSPPLTQDCAAVAPAGAEPAKKKQKLGEVPPRATEALAGARAQRSARPRAQAKEPEKPAPRKLARAASKDAPPAPPAPAAPKRARAPALPAPKAAAPKAKVKAPKAAAAAPPAPPAPKPAAPKSTVPKAKPAAPKAKAAAPVAPKAVAAPTQRKMPPRATKKGKDVTKPQGASKTKYTTHK